MNTPAKLLEFGGVLTISAFSALNTYEEMDQDVPLIVWPTILLSILAWAIVSYGVWQLGTQTNTNARWMAVLLFGVMLVSLFIHRYIGHSGTLGEAAWDIVAFTVLAIAVGFTAGTMRGMLMAAAGAAMLAIAKNVLLPYEARARTVYGPGMAFLPIAWALIVFAATTAAPAQPKLSPYFGGYV